MAAMLLLKRREVVSGRQTVVSRMGRVSDHFFMSVFGSVRRVISHMNRRTFISIAQWAAYHILIRVRGVYVEIKHQALSNPHSKKVIDAVRGRGEVSDHGASFYLRQISEK